MAVGDLITRNNQYECSGLLFGSNTAYVTDNWHGLVEKPDVAASDTDRQGAWGAYPGLALYKPRVISCDMSIDGAGQSDVEAKLRAFNRIMGVYATPVQFAWMRNDGLGKRFCWIDHSRASFPSDFALAHGLGVGSAEWTATDPRIYSITLHQDNIVIATNGTQQQANITNLGEEDAAPVFVVNGPCTNPRITNAQDGNRQIKLDIVLVAGDVLIIDTKSLTATLNGVLVASGVIRVDNQWTVLKPGVNQITYSRSVAAATSTTVVQHRDVWTV